MGQVPHTRKQRILDCQIDTKVSLVSISSTLSQPSIIRPISHNANSRHLSTSRVFWYAVLESMGVIGMAVYVLSFFLLFQCFLGVLVRAHSPPVHLYHTTPFSLFPQAFFFLTFIACRPRPQTNSAVPQLPDSKSTSSRHSLPRPGGGIRYRGIFVVVGAWTIRSVGVR